MCVAKAGLRVAVTITKQQKTKAQVGHHLPQTSLAATQIDQKEPKRCVWPHQRKSVYKRNLLVVPGSFMGKNKGQVSSALEKPLKLRTAAATQRSSGEIHQSQEITSKVIPQGSGLDKKILPTKKCFSLVGPPRSAANSPPR